MAKFCSKKFSQLYMQCYCIVGDVVVIPWASLSHSWFVKGALNPNTVMCPMCAHPRLPLGIFPPYPTTIQAGGVNSICFCISRQLEPHSLVQLSATCNNQPAQGNVQARKKVHLIVGTVARRCLCSKLELIDKPLCGPRALSGPECTICLH